MSQHRTRMVRRHYTWRRTNRLGPAFCHNDVRKSFAHFLNTAQMGQSRIRMGVLHLIWHREMRGSRKLQRSFSSMEPILTPARTRIDSHSVKYEQGDIVISNVGAVKRSWEEKAGCRRRDNTWHTVVGQTLIRHPLIIATCRSFFLTHPPRLMCSVEALKIAIFPCSSYPFP